MSSTTYSVMDGNSREFMVHGLASADSARDWVQAYNKNKTNKVRMLNVKALHSPVEVKKPDLAHSDIAIARFYLLKSERAAENGIEFNLSFTSFKNLSRACKCHFTGLKLDRDTFTIDRIDNTKGYIVGNVVACHKVFNQVKSIAENPANDVTINMLAKGFTIAAKKINEGRR